VLVDRLVLLNLFGNLLRRRRPRQVRLSLHLQNPRLEETCADVARLHRWFYVHDGVALRHLHAGEHQRPHLS